MCDKKYLVVVDKAISKHSSLTPVEETIDHIATSLVAKGEHIKFAPSYSEAAAYVSSTAPVDCVMVEWVPEQKEKLKINHFL